MIEVFEFQPFVKHFLFDYIRMACYSMIILTSLRNIANKKFTNLLFVGDIIISFAMILAALNIVTTRFNQEVIADKVLTPAAVLWAAVHFSDFLHQNGDTKPKKSARI